MLGASPVMHATQMASLLPQEPPAPDAAEGHAADAAAAAAAAAAQQQQMAAVYAATHQQAGGQSAQQQQQQAMAVGGGLPFGQMGATAGRGVTDAMQRKWHLGVQSSLAPADMMLEIFRALRALRFEWKIVAQYSLKCRPCTRPPVEPSGSGTLDASSMAVRCKVKVGLQLYKIQEDAYLLDIRKVDGDVLPFMDVCSLLLGELKL